MIGWPAVTTNRVNKTMGVSLPGKASNWRRVTQVAIGRNVRLARSQRKTSAHRRNGVNGADTQ